MAALPCEVCGSRTRRRAASEGSRWALCGRHGGVHLPERARGRYRLWRRIERRRAGDVGRVRKWAEAAA